MDALLELFTTAVGLMSLGAIGVTIGIGVFFARFINQRIDEEDAQRRKG